MRHLSVFKEPKKIFFLLNTAAPAIPQNTIYPDLPLSKPNPNSPYPHHFIRPKMTITHPEPD
jgi:hypothetical protein